MKYVYLAGPVTGLDFDKSTSWRQHAINKFVPPIVGLSPLRGMEYLKDVGILEGTYDVHPFSSQRGIYARDRYDCTRADVVLANFLNTSKVSIGTVMEIAWAADNNIPVVLAMKDGNVHDHPMIREACPFLVDDLDYAIEIVNAILTPSSHE